MNPYTLPDGNVLIAFSGGRTSGYMLHQILDANGGLPERVVVSFQNTGREMPETLDFVQECGERWNVPIVWLEYRDSEAGYEVVTHNSASRDGEPFEALIRKRKFLPNQAARFCTTGLKLRPGEKYLRGALGWENWVNCNGIRYDEPRRVKPHLEKVKGTRWVNWQPMAQAGETIAHVDAFWRRQPFALRLPTLDGNTWLGNCDGCFLKAEKKLVQLALLHPERAAWWERMEALADSITSGTGVTFSKRYSRTQLREFAQSQGEMFGGHGDALCQVDEGECFGE